jgi:hypothetical protein
VPRWLNESVFSPRWRDCAPCATVTKGVREMHTPFCVAAVQKAARRTAPSPSAGSARLTKKGRIDAAGGCARRGPAARPQIICHKRLRRRGGTLIPPRSSVPGVRVKRVGDRRRRQDSGDSDYAERDWRRRACGAERGGVVQWRVTHAGGLTLSERMMAR